ncbi:hypothetical protein [Priestia koreensis]|uniref:hypothetical protein n=1 Tax=Priestia koreensis TaxID=284581 RepID=UPI003017DD33
MLHIKISLPLLLVSTLLLGGCQAKSNAHGQGEQKPSEMKKEDLPKTRAFQDSFTRTFLTSTKEVKKGYYPFESKTKRYTMDFPTGGIVSDIDYQQKKNDFEFLLAGISYEDQSGGSLDLTYDSGIVNKNVKYELFALKAKASGTTEFKKMNIENKIVYWMPVNLSDGYYTYTGYIHPKGKNGGVEVIYSSKCQSENGICKSFNVDTAQSRFMSIIRSVKFTDG